MGGKWTPGPWRQGKGSPTYIILDDGSKPAKIIARTRTNDFTAAEASANAALIASAPGMAQRIAELEAGIKQALRTGNHWEVKRHSTGLSMMLTLEQALAGAEGEA